MILLENNGNVISKEVIDKISFLILKEIKEQLPEKFHNVEIIEVVLENTKEKSRNLKVNL